MVNTGASKKVLFRLRDEMKKDLTLALVKAGVGAQHVFEAVVERVIAFDRNDVQPGDKKFVAALLGRAKELQAEAKI